MEETPTGLRSSRMSYTESCIERTGWIAAAPILSRDFEFLQHAAAAHSVKRTGIALFASANICRWNARLTSKPPICGLSLVTLRYGHRSPAPGRAVRTDCRVRDGTAFRGDGPDRRRLYDIRKNSVQKCAPT